MQVRIINFTRPWRRVKSHIDARHCPDCGASVHGNQGQAEHGIHHIEHADLLQSLSDRIRVVEERAGIVREEDYEIPWTSVVDDSQAAIDD